MGGRFRQIGNKLLSACKENLPAETWADAMQTMRKTLSSENQLVCNQRGLVNMDISQSGVAIIELNDPAYYNGMSKELMSELLQCLKNMETLAIEGGVKALILTGKGAHFCTGAIMTDTKGERNQYSLELLSEIVFKMRKLPIPTLAVIHGKVIGGGLALSLAADWRVCSAKTTFNYGNLPLGMSAVMNLSLALPLTIGRGMANQVY